jgi:hypothetical protein
MNSKLIIELMALGLYPAEGGASGLSCLKKLFLFFVSHSQL